MHPALLDDRGLDQLRTALAGYTVEAVHERLGLPGQAALARADLAGVARATRTGTDRLTTLIRLFLLGADVPPAEARAAVAPLPLDTAYEAGLLAESAAAARALLDIRPYAEADSDAQWWLVSDFGADVRGGPLPADHVLGAGAAALTLAQATPRAPVGRALDVGTGCGIQALHLARHADAVVATDISPRALRLAATTAALSGQRWDLRSGSLLEPVADERFDLVVANPPFVVSAGGAGHDYRDSGLPGDAVCERLVRSLPGVLAENGTAQLLANWIIPADRPWTERIGDWLTGTGCDAWVWQREVAEPAEYVNLWLRDAGEVPGTPRWTSRYDAWLDWFEANGVAAVGLGVITLWRTEAAEPVIVCEDVRQPLQQPVGPALAAWHARSRWLAETPDAALLDSPLTAESGLVRTRTEILRSDGWQEATATVAQSGGMRWELEVDAPVAALIAGCTGAAPLRVTLAVLAASLGRPADEVAAAVLPVVRDLVGRGFLLPPGGGPG